MNEVTLGTLTGILLGPYGANIFDPRSSGTRVNGMTLEVMRVVLAIGLFAIGVELPRSYMAKHAKGLAAMVIPTMTIGWITVAGTVVLASLLTHSYTNYRDYLLLIPSPGFYS